MQNILNEKERLQQKVVVGLTRVIAEIDNLFEKFIISNSLKAKLVFTKTYLIYLCKTVNENQDERVTPIIELKEIIQSRINDNINMTPTGKLRVSLCDINIYLAIAFKELDELSELEANNE
jgi:hypothetical protein